MLKYNKYGRIVLDRSEFSDMINNIFEDWGLEDPTGKDDKEFIKVIKEIEGNVMKLKEKHN